MEKHTMNNKEFKPALEILSSVFVFQKTNKKNLSLSVLLVFREQVGPLHCGFTYLQCSECVVPFAIASSACLLMCPVHCLAKEGHRSMPCFQ